jgi:hypothetical protein
LRSGGVDLPVIGFPELPDTKAVEVVAVVGGEVARLAEPVGEDA